jgi:hypothetical protein
MTGRKTVLSKLRAICCLSPVIPHSNVELERLLHHYDRRSVASVFEPGELERMGAIQEESAAATALVLHHPIAPAVLPDKEQGGF